MRSIGQWRNRYILVVIWIMLVVHWVNDIRSSASDYSVQLMNCIKCDLPLLVYVRDWRTVNAMHGAETMLCLLTACRCVCGQRTRLQSCSVSVDCSLAHVRLCVSSALDCSLVQSLSTAHWLMWDYVCPLHSTAVLFSLCRLLIGSCETVVAARAQPLALISVALLHPPTPPELNSQHVLPNIVKRKEK